MSVGIPYPRTERQRAGRAHVLEASSNDALSSRFTGMDMESSTCQSAVLLAAGCEACNIRNLQRCEAAPSLPERRLG